MSKPFYCCEKPQLEWRGIDLTNLWIECVNCGFVLCDDGLLADWHDPEEITRAKELALEGCVLEMVCQYCHRELDNELSFKDCHCLCHKFV